jgi:hypothetical protein
MIDERPDSESPQVHYSSRVKVFAQIQTHSGLANARACRWGGIFRTAKSGSLSHRYMLLTRFFLRAQNILLSSLTSNQGDPHGQRAYWHCLSRCPLSRTPGKLFTPAVQGIKNAHLQQANALVRERRISLNPLSWRHIMAIRGKQHMAAYVMSLVSRTPENTMSLVKRAVAWLRKARDIFTDRTKKAKPHQTKTGGIYPSGWVNGAIKTRTMLLQGSWADLQGESQLSLSVLGFQ